MTTDVKPVEEGGASQQPLVPAGLQIVAVSLRELSYEEIGREENESGLTDGQTSYDINGAIDVRPPDLVQVAMKFNLRANPKERPIKLSAVITATFRRGKEVDMDQMAEFVRVRSHLILFPYMRELVSSITGRGVYGALYLHPVVLPPMMEAEEMKARLVGLDPSASAVMGSAPILAAPIRTGRSGAKNRAEIGTPKDPNNP